MYICVRVLYEIDYKCSRSVTCGLSSFCISSMVNDVKLMPLWLYVTIMLNLHGVDLWHLR